jgi:hypothetical protein
MCDYVFRVLGVLILPLITMFYWILIAWYFFFFFLLYQALIFAMSTNAIVDMYMKQGG